MSTYNLIFDFSYYGLAGALTLVLASTILLGFKVRHGSADEVSRNRALGIALAALGALVSVSGGVTMDTLAKNGAIGGVAYLQVEFSVFYAGFAFVFYGVYATIVSARGPNLPPGIMSHRGKVRLLMWIPFILAVAISSSYLFSPGTYVATYSGGVQHVAQQQIFFLPLFLTLAIGTIGLATIALRSEDIGSRRHALWFGLFTALSFMGVLREATIIPSSGDPLTDLLVAFVPFAVGSVCLFVAASMLRHFATHAEIGSGPEGRNPFSTVV